MSKHSETRTLTTSLKLPKGGKSAMALAMAMGAPADAPLINVSEVARYVGRTPAAVRQTMVRALSGQDDKLGRALNEIKVHIGRRVMFRKPDLLEWLKVQE